jgi:heavy metal efflux system protein
MKTSISILFGLSFVALSVAQEQQLDLQSIIDSALLKHPKLLNARLNTDIVSISWEQSINIGRTEITYQHGYLFPDVKGSELEIRQNVGSPLEWVASSNIVRKQKALSEAENKLLEKQVISEIKKAYFECIYRQVRYNLLKHQQKEIFEMIKKDSLQHLSDSAKIERLLIENTATDLASQSDMAYNDLLMAENNLVQAAFLDYETVPADTVLEMYQLLPISDTSTRTPARLYTAAANTAINVEKARLKETKSHFYPELYLGYRNFIINSNNSMYAWNVGLSMPIYFFPQKAVLQKSKLNVLKAENERNWQESAIQARAANLMVMLNKDFERINYFYDFGLEQASQIEMAVKEKYRKNNNLSYSDIQHFIKAYTIKLDYFETLNRYNQNAIELEVYAY